MSDAILDGSAWVSIEGRWELWTAQGGRVLVSLRKDRDLWYGRVPPRTTDHLAPCASLHDAMKQAELHLKTGGAS